MDCLQPPLAESPPGRWHCPLCPPLEPDPTSEMEYYASSDPETQPISDSSPQQSVDPSSSRRRPLNGHKRKGKQIVRVSDDEDSDMDMDEEEEEEIEVESAVSKVRRKRRPSKKNRVQYDSDDGEASSPVTAKRSRIRVMSPVPPRSRMVVRLRIPAKGKGKERDDDDGPPKGLFDDILGVSDRDTVKTNVENGDKMRFERSRLAAEVRPKSFASSVAPFNHLAQEKLAPPAPPPPPDVADTFHAGSLYRPLRSSTLQHVSMPVNAPTPGMSASPAPSTPGPSSGMASITGLRIRTIRFGEFDIQTWYDAPFPEEYANIPDGRMWICEFCLKYMKSRFGAVRHRVRAITVLM